MNSVNFKVENFIVHLYSVCHDARCYSYIVSAITSLYAK